MSFRQEGGGVGNRWSHHWWQLLTQPTSRNGQLWGGPQWVQLAVLPRGKHRPLLPLPEDWTVRKTFSFECWKGRRLDSISVFILSKSPEVISLAKMFLPLTNLCVYAWDWRREEDESAMVFVSSELGEHSITTRDIDVNENTIIQFEVHKHSFDDSFFKATVITLTHSRHKSGLVISADFVCICVSSD